MAVIILILSNHSLLDHHATSYKTISSRRTFSNKRTKSDERLLAGGECVAGDRLPAKPPWSEVMIFFVLISDGYPLKRRKTIQPQKVLPEIMIIGILNKIAANKEL